MRRLGFVFVFLLLFSSVAAAQTCTASGSGGTQYAQGQVNICNGSSWVNVESFTTGGNVGIGTASPVATLDVNGGIRPVAATLGAACSPLGAQAYNSSSGAPVYCNGSVWTAVVASGGVGVNQTWQDMTASRAFSTVYQNTSGNPIEVVIHWGNPSGAYVYPYVGSTSSASIELAQIGVVNLLGGFSFIVPNNWYYKVTTLGSPTLVKWTELR